jgi:small-conductance mechanosensitive channel/CRP-like cAMP-binding protein
LTGFLQSNLPLAAGALLLLVILGVRTLTRDKALRADLRAAFVLQLCFIALRLCEWSFQAHLSGTAATALRLSWMLAFAFGAIRFSVGVALWSFRLRTKRPTPKIVRDVLSTTLYAIACLPVLKTTLQIDLAGLLATSAILSVVLGLAMQDTLGNLFAGLSLQLERPFEVGDFVSIGEHTGQIAQIGWRATRIETRRLESVTLPNNIIAKGAVKNYTRTDHPIGVDVYIGVSLRVPPNKVKTAVMQTLCQIEEVLPTPAPHCRTFAYEESSIRYQVRMFCRGFEQMMLAQEQLHTRLWYRFERDGIEIPHAQRVVHMRAEAAAQQQTATDAVLGLLSSVDLLRLLKVEDLQLLAREIKPRRYAKDERIIAEGTAGNTFYVVAQGHVSVRAGRPEVEVATLRHGQYFGEMCLLTGEPRAASVYAGEDVVLYEITRPIFAKVLESNPGLAQALADLLARRRTELRAAAQSNVCMSEVAPEARRIFGRLRELFRLTEA